MHVWLYVCEYCVHSVCVCVCVRACGGDSIESTSICLATYLSVCLSIFCCCW